jgi:hypothetical protein
LRMNRRWIFSASIALKAYIGPALCGTAENGG